MTPSPPRDLPADLRGTPDAREEDVFVFPASFAQERLWFLEQLEPSTSTFNIPSALRLSGSLDVAALERALNEIARRHEAVRTTFRVVDDQPVQVIAPSLTVIVPLVDLTGLPEAEREAEARRLAGEDARRPFDLATGPLLRAALLRLDAAEHVLLLTKHHIVSDGWSRGILNRELAALYGAYSAGRPSPLPELPIQYADFAAWQRQWFRGEVLERQLAYWKGQLAGAPPVLELPTDRARPPAQSFRGERHSFLLPRPPVEALGAISRREGVTLFMTLLAAFKVLLARHTEQDDIVVGSPIAGRNRVEIEPLIGFFVNTLVLRTDLAGDPTFRELLRRVRALALGAYAHQDLPFEKLLAELRPARDPGRTPLFQTMFALQNASREAPRLPGLTVRPFAVDTGTAKFDLTVVATEAPEGLELSFRYSSDLFERGTVERLARHYRTLLEAVAADATRRLSGLPLLTPAERRRLAAPRRSVASKGPPTDFGKDALERSIAARFTWVAKHYPDNVAVRTERNEWTYAALDDATTTVARAILRRRGPGEGRVALLFEHDAPMIAGILGVLKAGKTYVPLDPSDPVARIASALDDADPGAILTDGTNISLAHTLSRGRVQVISVDEARSSESCEDDLPLVSADTTAYIIYTSGSTGQPKGVVQNHRNVLAHVRNYANSLAIGPRDRLTLLSAYTFDAAVMDIFGALLNGATLYPINLREGHSSLLDCLVNERITIYHSTPSVYRSFLKGLAGSEDLSSVRLVVLGGEEVLRRDVDLFQEHFSPDCVLINGFGPTESTLALQYVAPGGVAGDRTAVPVGYPVEDVEVLLVNGAGEQVGTYAVGEIRIRSPYVALGYWNRPELTRAAFLPDPEGGERRIYCTGDLGRLLPDGSIEFVGRKDSQVKIRGHRVELGEVETKLLEHPLIKEVAVLAREDEPGDRRLVAYVVPDRLSPPTVGDVRGFLLTKLPAYMVPSAFVLLEALPLSPHGKLDRRALPAPARARPETPSGPVAPRNLLESRLAAIWEEVLGIRPIGVTDDYFELGGHSLLAVGLFARIERAFDRALPLSSLFQRATIEHLAGLLARADAPIPVPALVPFQPGSSRRPFFCVHDVFGDVLCYARLARHLGPDRPFYALQPPGLDGAEAPFRDIVALAAYHVDRLRSVQPEGPYALGGLCSGGVVAFEMACQLRAQGQAVALVALFDGAAPKSGYRHVTWDSTFLRNLPRDLPSWLAGAAQLSPAQWSHLLRVKARRAKSRLRSITHPSGTASPRDVAARFVGEAGAPDAFTEHHRAIAEAMVHGLRAYVPGIYPDRVTLFRARMQPLFCSHDLENGWGPLAAGGVEVRAISGNHLGMLQEPHVRVLADQLRACLDRAPADGAAAQRVPPRA